MSENNKYTNTFNNLKENKRIAFIPFWMIGYPTINDSKEIIKKIAENADILELGFPFSDPLADGPVIQEAINDALKANSTTKKCFNVLEDVRKNFPNKPIGLLVYFNLMISYGIEEFFKKCNELGIDSILIPELPIEEVNQKINNNQSINFFSEKYNVDLIFLVSTNTPKKRREKIFNVASGFIYAVSKPTVTGAVSELGQNTLEMVQNFKKETNTPICVGFGISNPEHIKQLHKSNADGAIIGSKLISIFKDKGLSEVIKFCKECFKATK